MSTPVPVGAGPVDVVVEGFEVVVGVVTFEVLVVVLVLVVALVLVGVGVVAVPAKHW